jgi:hypothetical protein
LLAIIDIFFFDSSDMFDLLLKTLIYLYYYRTVITSSRARRVWCEYFPQYQAVYFTIIV